MLIDGPCLDGRQLAQRNGSAASCDAGSAVFDGQGDHAGEHLTYKRSGDSLLIIGDFLHHGTPSRMEWHMARAGD
jgi:hypothetical protein